MNYEYSNKAGYYGTGTWVIYSYDCIGRKRFHAALASERDAIDYLRWGNNYKALRKREEGPCA